MISVRGSSSSADARDLLNSRVSRRVSELLRSPWNFGRLRKNEVSHFDLVAHTIHDLRTSESSLDAARKHAGVTEAGRLSLSPFFALHSVMAGRGFLYFILAIALHAQAPAFDAASIKPTSASGPTARFHGSVAFSPGRAHGANVNIRRMIQAA